MEITRLTGNQTGEMKANHDLGIAHEIIKVPEFDQSRIIVAGHADAKPLVPNTNALNRRKNRRVEIAINQGKAQETEPVSIIQ